MGSESLEVPLSTEDVLLGIVLPGAIALIVLFIGWSRWRRNAPRASGHWAAPVAFAIAFVTGFIELNHGVPSFPPAESSHRLFFLVPGLLLIALVLNLRKLTTIGAALIVAIVSAAAFRYGLAFKFRTMAPTHALTWTAICAVVVTLWWIALTSYAKSSPRIAAPLALFILAGATSVLFMLSDTLSNGRCELTLLAAAAAAVLAAAIFRHFSFARSGGIFMFVILTTLLIGHSYLTAGLTTLDMSLLLSAPIVLWLASLIPLRMKPRKRVVVHLVLLSIPLGIATARAAVAFNRANRTASQSEEADL
jgi:hypothetical protein